MPTPATMQRAPGATGRGSEQAPLPTVPFIRASAEHREPSGIDVTRVLTTADQELPLGDVPAYGYARAVVVLVTATGGAGVAGVAAEDAPFSIIRNIALTEPNGAVISQFSSGYGMYLASKWGGYRPSFGSDPKASPIFSFNAATGNFSFLLRIPLELNLRDGLGSLPNQNSAALFKLRMTLGAASTAFTTAPTTLPSVRVQTFLEAWDQPALSGAGQSNQVSPPAMNTTQFWTEQTYNVNAGQQNIRLTRIGNYLRNLICVFRRAGTSRANGHTDFPNPMQFMLDTRPLDTIERNNWLNQMYERSGYGGAHGATVPANDSPNGLDNGVFVYDFMHEFDGSYGRENRDLWLPTLGSTRLEFGGSFTNAGTLTVYTNDVAIAGNVFI